MPQIRKSAAKNLQFSVSPWHFKQPAGGPNVRQTHQETYLTLEPDQPVHPAAATNVQSKAKRPVQQHVNESKWQVRKRPAPSDDTQQATVSDVHTQQSSQEQSSDTSEDEDPSEICTSGALLQGTAVLAFLPSGQLSGRLCSCFHTCYAVPCNHVSTQYVMSDKVVASASSSAVQLKLAWITGHFVDKQSKKCFGIMGVQLTALRECTRDVEWKLMKITIINFDSKAECQFAAERTAADAARVQAPLQFHGDEPELAEALNGLAPSDVQLQFECHTIMVSPLTIHILLMDKL